MYMGLCCGYVQTMTEAIGLLADLVNIGEYPRPATRDKIITQLLHVVTGGEGVNEPLANLIQNPGAALPSSLTYMYRSFVC